MKKSRWLATKIASKIRIGFPGVSLGIQNQLTFLKCYQFFATHLMRPFSMVAFVQKSHRLQAGGKKPYFARINGYA